MLVVRLCAELRRAGCDAEVVGLTGGGALEEQLRARDVPFVVAPQRPHLPLWPAGLLAVARERAYDVLHGHSGTLVPLALAGRLRGVPTVYTEHGYYPDEPSLARWVQALPARMVGRLVAVSGALRATMQRRFWLRKAPIVVENGVELPDPPPASERDRLRRSVGAAPDELVIGTVGRLVPVKDQASLIRAFARVRASVPALRLVIVGDGPERTALEALAGTLGLRADVVFTGARSDAAALTHGFDVYVSSSISEGMPMAVLEAMAGGRAVVATRVGACDELLAHGDAGVLVPPGEPRALADAVLALVLDPARRAALGDAARARAEAHYRVESCAARYFAIYRSVVR